MPVEVGGINLTHLTQIMVREQTRLVRHAVPGLAGDLTQTVGRPSVEVEFHGIFVGATAGDELGALRRVHLSHEPVDFFTEAVGEGFFTQVVIERLEVAQRAGYLDQFDYACTVVEYVEPPAPVTANPLAALDTDLIGEASAFVDDVQNTLAEVSALTDLIANAPSFADPTTRLPALLERFTTAASGGPAVLSTIRDLL